MEQRNGTVFDVLNSVNVNEHTEKRTNQGVELTYLSWSWAWAEVKKRYPDASYEIVKFNGLPYVGEPEIGYMVYTRVTIEGMTHEMWLPVMDGANRTLKKEPYVIENKFGKKSNVSAMTMFDVNKAVMRCLTKNLAMFGLGLYIYSGEDIPEAEMPEKVEKTEKAEKPKNANLASVEDRKELFIAAKTVYGAEFADTLKGWFKEIGVSASEELTKDQVKALLSRINQYADEEYTKQSA